MFTMIVALIIPVSGQALAAAGPWVSITPMSQSRQLLKLGALADGKAIAIGGNNGVTAAKTAEIYNPGTNLWTATGQMAVPRFSHGVAMLSNGKIMAVGGLNFSDGTLSSSEIYDPATGTWSTAASMSTARSSISAIALHDGRVMVIGGSNDNGDLATTELYDPVTGSWSPGASLPYTLREYGATLLDDGRVMVIGGQANENMTNRTQIYDPASDSWTAANNLPSARFIHASATAKDGRVYVIGGFTSSYTPETSTLVYDPDLDSWGTVTNALTGRLGHSAVTLTDGRILVSGGAGTGLPISSAEIYTPSLRTHEPKADVPAGAIPSGTVVTLSTKTDGGAIYYTTNGSTPTSASTLYTGPVSVSSTMTIKAVTIKSGWTTGAVLTQAYTVTAPNLNNVTLDVAGGKINNTSTAMEYSIDSVDGTGGTWTTASAGSTSVTFAPGKVYVREAGNPSNVRLVATISAPASAPSVTVDVTAGVTAAKLVGATTAMEYSMDGGMIWIAVTAGLASGTDSLNLGGTAADLRVRVAATASSLASLATSRLNPEPIDLSVVAVDVAAGQLKNTTTAMEYSLNSTNGTDGSWTAAGAGSTSVAFIPGKAYVREAGNPANARLVATIATPALAPSVTVDVTEGVAAAKLAGATTAMEYSTDGGTSWHAVTAGLAAGTDRLDLGGVTANLQVRIAATQGALASASTARLNPEPLNLSNVGIDVAAGRIMNTASSMEYSLNSTDGSAGSWTAAGAGSTMITMAPGKVYVREAGNPANVRLVATISAPALAPSVTADVSRGVTDVKLVGATTAMEYSKDGGMNWAAVTAGLASGTDSLNLGGTAADLRVRVAATASSLASLATSRLNPEPLDLSGVAVDIAAGQLKNTTTAMEYSFNSTNGTDGSWTAAGAGSTSVVFLPGSLYVRQANNPVNVRLVATIASPAPAPAVTMDAAGGVSAAKLVGATTAMEYSMDGGTSWHAVTPALAAGTDRLNLGGTTADLRIRMAATVYALPSAVSSRLNPQPLNLNEVTMNVAAGQLQQTSQAMEFSLDSSDGTDGQWRAAAANMTGVTFVPGKVYVREAGNPSNVRLVATIPDAAVAPSVTVNVYRGESAAVLVGATTAMEYSLDGGVSWRPVTPELAAGTSTLDLSGVTTDLRVRTAATATALASVPTNRLYTVRLNSDATMQSFSLSGLTLTATVSSNVYQYTALDTYASSTTVSTVTGSVYATTTIKLNGAVAANPLNLVIGMNTISLEIIAQDGTSKSTYTVTVHRIDPYEETSSGTDTDSGTPSSSGGSPASGGNTAVSVPPSGHADIAPDGVATVKTEITNGIQTAVVVVDSQKMMDKLEKENSKVVSIPVSGNHSAVVGELSGQLVRAAGEQAAMIELRTDRAIYALPANLIDITAVSLQLGAGAQNEDLAIKIRMAESTGLTVKQVSDAASAGGQTIMVPPVDFEITVSYGDRTVEINRFDAYVERFIAIPNGVDASRITTGVVLNADGTLSHVPTKVVVKDGKYYAQINSLTNSTYSVIWNPRSFADVANHWSKNDVNDMAGRLVVQGVSDRSFEPDRNVTRAEFAAVAVRALGLNVQPQEAIRFQDVQTGDWYAGFVAAAVRFGLIEGYEDGTFRPERTISRNEAVVMVSRAMSIAKLQGKLSAEETDKRLVAMKDGNSVAEWARPAFAAAMESRIVQGDDGFVHPQENVTRAQTAAMFRRMLQAAGLINP